MKTAVVLREVEVPQNLTYLEAIGLFYEDCIIKDWISIHVEQNWFSVVWYQKRMCFVGRKHFMKTFKSAEFCKTRTGKLYGAPDFIFRRTEVMEALKIEWVMEVPMSMRCKKSVAADIILHKYTNVENLYKTYIKRYYKGAFAWKDVREYHKRCTNISLQDILDFTTNPGVALGILVKSRTCDDITCLLEDCIQLAIKLDERVNPLWSEARLHAEHTRQNRAINKAKLDKMPAIPIHSEEICKLLQYPGLELINTEARCYQEALDMVNCVHSIHWHWLQARKRVAFHLSKPESACVEFYVNDNGELTLSEARGVRNTALKPATMELINYICKGFNLRGVGKLIRDTWDTPKQIFDDLMPF